MEQQFAEEQRRAEEERHKAEEAIKQRELELQRLESQHQQEVSGASVGCGGSRGRQQHGLGGSARHWR